jgi:hypothetical protein
MLGTNELSSILSVQIEKVNCLGQDLPAARCQTSRGLIEIPSPGAGNAD